MSEISSSPVGVIQRFLLDEFKSVPPELLTPESRVDHLVQSVLSNGDKLLTLGEEIPNRTIHALDDLQFIAAGAMRYASEVYPDEPIEAHVLLVRKSAHGLAFPTHLSDARWQEIRERYSEPDSSDYWRTHLSPEVLFLMTEASTGIKVISYSSAALADMDSFIDSTGVSGCPARGIVVQSTLSLFVDAVFNPAQNPDSLHGSANNITNQLQVVQ